MRSPEISPPPPLWLRVLPQVLLVVVFALLYGFTLLPGLHHFGDTTKAQFLGRLLGTTHPTGYPLYILSSVPFAWLPIGTLAGRLNAFSAVLAIAALLGVYGIQRRLGVRPAFAWLAAAALGVSRIFWDQSVIAEVYSLNAALVAFTLYSLVRWDGRADQKVWFFVACAVYSLSFGNHLTVVTLLPAFAYATFTGDFRALLRPQSLAVVVACILLGASLYGYVLTRTKENTLYLEYSARTLRELWSYVTASDYQGRMFAFPLRAVLLERLPRFLSQFLRDLGPLSLLALAGVALCKNRRAAVVLLLSALGELLWVLTYDIPDIEVYGIPVELVLAVFTGVTLDALAGRAPFKLRSLAVFGGSLALVTFSATKNAPDHEQSLRFERHIDEQLTVLGERAVIVGGVHYNPRMALVHRLYAERSFERNDLHLAYDAPPAAVARYLAGEPTLVDSHTGARLPLGLRVFVTERAFKLPWRRASLSLHSRGSGLRELMLKKR